ncbi:hypothetical protein SAMN06298226_2349 [Nitrosovibrio sp. Nv4]|nr:hypothetical protein SAMN06298226_2349 [Nitrosovibrio sp. Nv4]
MALEFQVSAEFQSVLYHEPLAAICGAELWVSKSEFSAGSPHNRNGKMHMGEDLEIGHEHYVVQLSRSTRPY